MTKGSSIKRPFDITLDEEGNSYVADFGNHRVQVFNTPRDSDITDSHSVLLNNNT